MKDVLLGGGGGGGTTVNVFQNDVTWNNDANLSKPLPRGLLGIAELVLITLFPNLGIGRATLAVLAEHMFVVVGMSVSQFERTCGIHPQLRLPLPSSLCEQEFLMWVSSSLSSLSPSSSSSEVIDARISAYIHSTW